MTFGELKEQAAKLDIPDSADVFAIVTLSHDEWNPPFQSLPIGGIEKGHSILPNGDIKTTLYITG